MVLLKVKEISISVIWKARPVSYLYLEAVENYLDHSIKSDLIDIVQNSEWATFLAAAPKYDGESVRLCGDIKVTIITVTRKILCLPEPGSYCCKSFRRKIFF